MSVKKKVLRVAAAPGSLGLLLKGQLKYLNQFYEVKGIASEDPTLHDLARDEEVEVISININRKISPVQDLVSLFKLYSVFRKEKPFIVHSITPKAGLLSMAAAYLARVPNRLHTFTGLIFPTSKGFLKTLLIFFDKVICFCATKIYPEGNGVKNDLINYRITKKPLTVIGHGNVNGIDLNNFDPERYTTNDIANLKKENGISEKDFVFLFVGRMVNDKGISELVTAFTAIQKKNEHVKLLIVGSNSKFHDPIAESIENELNSNTDIIQVGWQTDVRPYFAISNVFVFPSYREGFPNTVLQAGAMGKYSIVTNISGSNEIIEDGVNGKIIPSKDAESLEVAMQVCLETKNQYEVYTPAYRKIIADKYEQSFVWAAILEEYQKLN